MRKFALLPLLGLLLSLMVANQAGAYTYNFSISASEIIADIQASGDSLHGNYTGSSGPTGESRWGILGLRILPVNVGSYTLSTPATSVTAWVASLPAAGFVGSPSYYTGGSFAYYKINDNYWPTVDLIADSPIIDFPAKYASFPPSTLIKIADTATFSFTLTSSTLWSGDYRFLVDGVKYLYSEAGSQSPDPHEFTAGQYDSLGLRYNNGPGYPVPLPGSVFLLGSGLLGLVGFRWRVRKK